MNRQIDPPGSSGDSSLCHPVLAAPPPGTPCPAGLCHMLGHSRASPCGLHTFPRVCSSQTERWGWINSRQFVPQAAQQVAGPAVIKEHPVGLHVPASSGVLTLLPGNSGNVPAPPRAGHPSFSCWLSFSIMCLLCIFNWLITLFIH